MARKTQAAHESAQQKITRLHGDIKRAERALEKAKRERAGPCRCQLQAQEDPIEAFEKRKVTFEYLMTALRGGPFIPPQTANDQQAQP